MKFNDLTTTANRNSRRVGRGISAGQGKTAGRGTKGQKSRTGSNRRPGFEGGQTPLMQRLPKLGGFQSNTPKAENVNLAQLDNLKGGAVDNHSLAEAGLVSSPHTRVKLIGNQPTTKKLTIKLQAASKTAIASVQKAGGSFEKVPQVGRKSQPKTDKPAR